MLPTTIDGVIEELDRTIATARRDESRLGYFPALYRKVTASVQQGIADGRFEDGDRMEPEAGARGAARLVRATTLPTPPRRQRSMRCRS
ncbi:MAG: hypothetical protein IH849_10770 [Acidobacteria bacterium]|nr:hypothetical protein [Acidobacteriota bacterium]